MKKKTIKTIFIILIIFKILFIGETTTKTTPAGKYVCYGGLLKVCTGSNEVYNYINETE